MTLAEIKKITEGPLTRFKNWRYEKKLDAFYKKASGVKLEKRDTETTILAGSLVGIFTGCLAWYILWHIGPLRPFPYGSVDPRTTGSLSGNISKLWLLETLIGKQDYKIYYWPTIKTWLVGTGNYYKLEFIMWFSLCAGLIAGIRVGKNAGKGRPSVTHVEGRQMFEGHKFAIQGAAGEIKVSGKGLAIHPKIHISRDRETRHFFIMGAIGAGKTQALWSIIKAIIERFKEGPEDRIIMYDNKSDFTREFPVPDEQMALFAPWDARTWAWDVGKDILNEVDANELCKRIIPDSDDPFWSNAARQVLLGIIVKLQRTKGTDWSWKDLNQEMGSPEGLAETVNEFNPVMGSLFRDPSSKTAQSVVTTLATFAATIRLLTQAWDNVDPYSGEEYEEGRVIPRLSLREWALAPQVEKRVLILQGNKRYETLEQSYIQAIISAFGAIMNSPEMVDSKTRRIWFILDEFPQLGKLTNFAQYLEVGRSKGMCVIMGLQDIAQLRDIYGREKADVWASIAGTYIICRSQGVETVDWIKKFFGERVIKRWTVSIGKDSTSKSEHNERVTLVNEQDLMGLGPKELGVQAILSLNNEHGIYRIVWPYMKFPTVRESQVPAGWTFLVQNDTVVYNETSAAALRSLGSLFGPSFDKDASGKEPVEETPSQPGKRPFFPEGAPVGNIPPVGIPAGERPWSEDFDFPGFPQRGEEEPEEPPFGEWPPFSKAPAKRPPMEAPLELPAVDDKEKPGEDED